MNNSGYIKLKSFTVLEMMLALLISSFVIGFAYYFLYLVNGRFVKTGEETKVFNDWFLFRRAMGNDFLKADMIECTTGEIVFFRNDESKKVVRYSYTANAIIRNEEGVIDSFTNFRQIVFSNQVVNDTIGLVKNTFIEVQAAGTFLNTGFHKEYSAIQIFKFSNPDE